MEEAVFFVNAKKMHQFKTNTSGDISANNIKKKKKTGLNWCVFDFSVDYWDFNISDITNIHKYLMKKHI